MFGIRLLLVLFTTQFVGLSANAQEYRIDRLPFVDGEMYDCTQNGFALDFPTHDDGPSLYYDLDFSMPVGTTVVAAKSGYAKYFEGYNGGWGNHIKIFHDPFPVEENVDHFTLYAHLSSSSISKAELTEVSVGDEIGKSGNTGNSEAPHLHFGVHRIIDGVDTSISMAFFTSEFQMVDDEGFNKYTKDKFFIRHAKFITGPVDQVVDGPAGSRGGVYCKLEDRNYGSRNVGNWYLPKVDVDSAEGALVGWLPKNVQCHEANQWFDINNKLDLVADSTLQTVDKVGLCIQYGVTECRIND